MGVVTTAWILAFIAWILLCCCLSVTSQMAIIIPLMGGQQQGMIMPMPMPMHMAMRIPMLMPQGMFSMPSYLAPRGRSAEPLRIPYGLYNRKLGSRGYLRANYGYRRRGRGRATGRRGNRGRGRARPDDDEQEYGEDGVIDESFGPERSGGRDASRMSGRMGGGRGYGGRGGVRYGKKSVLAPFKKKEKKKIISVQSGFYIPGGTQAFGKFKSLKACTKACATAAPCFSGDYDPWLKKCYMHSNLTACNTLQSHPKLVHFSKVPCTVPNAPEGLITLGAQLFNGLEQRGVKSLSECIKLCATAGQGIPVSVADIAQQLCFGIDYDFGSHKCYFHVDADLCPPDGTTPTTPRDLVANLGVINIILCPGP